MAMTTLSPGKKRAKKNGGDRQTRIWGIHLGRMKGAVYVDVA